MVDKKIIVKNISWNFVGSILPLIAAIFSIPILIKHLGVEYFGIFTLALMVIGYFSLFDVGIGRALTKFVSVEIGTGNSEKIPIIVGTGLFLMFLFSIIGLIISIAISSWMVKSVLIVPIDLQEETIKIFYLLSISLPLIIITSGLRGVLEAYQRFALLNIINIPMGVFNFIAPLAVLPFTNSLFPIVVVLVIGRLLGLLILAISCYRVMNVPIRHVIIQQKLIMPMLRFGGWMTVTAIIGPIMVYADRFLIGTVITIAILAYYTTPYEMITKLWIIPSAIIRVLFPVFAMSYIKDKERMSSLYFKSMKYIFLIMFPVAIIIVTFANELLTFWLGSVFANKSYMILQILTIGVLVNSISQVPYTMIQSIGRPDITAKLHFIELPFYLIIVWFMVDFYGIVGAAIAWTLRIIIDTILLFWFSHIFLHLKGSKYCVKKIFIVISGSLSMFLIAVLLNSFLVQVFFLISFVLVFTYIVWQLFLTLEEKNYVTVYLNLIKTKM